MPKYVISSAFDAPLIWLFSSRKSFQFMPLLQPISLQPIFLLLLLPLPF